MMPKPHSNAPAATPDRPRAARRGADVGVDAGDTVLRSDARAEFVRAGVEYLLGQRSPATRGAARRVTTRKGGSPVADPGSPTPGALGIRLVAELTGRSHAASLFHFPDRTTLVAAVAAEGFRRLADALTPTASRARSGATRLRDVALGYARWAGDAPALFASMYDPDLAPGLELLMVEPDDARALQAISARHGGDDGRAWRRLQAFRELMAAKEATLNAFLDAVDTGVSDGSLRQDTSPRQLAHAVASMADGLAWQRVTEPQGSRALLDRHATLSLSLLLEGIAGGRG